MIVFALSEMYTLVWETFFNLASNVSWRCHEGLTIAYTFFCRQFNFRKIESSLRASLHTVDSTIFITFEVAGKTYRLLTSRNNHISKWGQTHYITRPRPAASPTCF